MDVNPLSSEIKKISLSQFINFNGSLLDETSPVVKASNRSLRYGDGLFESMRWENDRISLGDFHFERLFHGLNILQMERRRALRQIISSHKSVNSAKRIGRKQPVSGSMFSGKKARRSFL